MCPRALVFSLNESVDGPTKDMISALTALHHLRHQATPRLGLTPNATGEKRQPCTATSLFHHRQMEIHML